MVCLQPDLTTLVARFAGKKLPRFLNRGNKKHGGSCCPMLISTVSDKNRIHCECAPAHEELFAIDGPTEAMCAGVRGSEVS